MADVLTKEQRHKCMQAVHSKDTSVEVKLRQCLFARGFRFRKNNKKLAGSPDIVFPKYKTAIFVHGCFWHRHENCRLTSNPKTRVRFWKAKFKRNIERDKRISEELIESGWHVIVVWECEIRNDVKAVVDELEKIMKYMVPAATKKLYVPGLDCFIQSKNKNKKLYS